MLALEKLLFIGDRVRVYLIELIAHYVLYLHKKSAILLQLCH